MSCYIFIIEYTCHSNKYRINVTAIEQNFKWVKKISLSCFFYLTDEICSLIFSSSSVKMNWIKSLS